MVIIQRRDAFTGLWVDVVARHSIWTPNERPGGDAESRVTTSG